MLGWTVVLFIIVAGVGALLAFVVARDATSVAANVLSYCAAIVLTALIFIGGDMVLNHTLVVDFGAFVRRTDMSTLAAPFVGALMGLWWARQYRRGR